MSEVRRIYITGGAGVGKTTVAHKLAESTGFPFYELDQLLWTNESTGERIPEPERLKIVADIAGQPTWITDGVYVGWAQDLWRDADLVIFIDIPLRKMLWRVFWRHVKAELNRNNRHPGWLNLFTFLRYTVRIHRSSEVGDIDSYSEEGLTHAKILAKAHQQSHKTLIINGNPDFEQILSMINSTESA
jgi:adenylate kinase family enzyme